MLATCGPTPEVLDDHEVHLWYVFTATVQDTAFLRTLERLLSAEETVKHLQLKYPKDRRQYLIAHGLLRMILSRYVTIHPSEWRFSHNAYGKPAISAPSPASQLQFSISHTDGLAACAVSRCGIIGIDVENVERPVAIEKIARRSFSAREAADIERLPNAERLERAFQYWTLKEAYIKALGLGLSIPLDSFWFNLTADGTASIHFHPTAQEETGKWQFHRLCPSSQHRLAVAIQYQTEMDPKVVTHEGFPSLEVIG